MSELLEGRGSDFARYDQMSTEELQQIIWKDALEDGNPTVDQDTIRYILEVLLNREMNESAIGKSETEIAWQQFQKYYQPYTDSFENLYEDDTEKLGHGMRKVCREMKIRRARLFRYLSRVVAAMVIVVCCGTFATNALGLNLGEILAHWTDEIFSFRRSISSTPLEDDESRLKDAIQLYHIPEGCLPTASPKGYSLNEIQVNPADETTFVSVIVTYHNDRTDGEYYVYIKNLTYDVASTFEKDATSVVIHEKNGVQYFLNSNNESKSVVWQLNNYECAIIGDLSLDEIESIINSL